MPTVGQIRMQAAESGVNAAYSKSSAMPDSRAMPVGFEAFLAALDPKSTARLQAQSGVDRSTVSTLGRNASSMQNLPLMRGKTDETAKISDPLQLLMAQLAAQNLLNTALVAPNQTNLKTNSDNADSSAAALNIQEMIKGLNGQVDTQNQSLLGLANGQQLDAKQTALISQALSKAMKSAGQGAETAMQGQAALLLQAMQQQSLGQAGTQSPAQIASAIQNLAQKNGITLPPELQNQLTNLINQGQASGGIKLLGVEGASQPKAGLVVEQGGVVDPTKATAIQNIVDAKTNVMTSAGDKLSKVKTGDAILAPGALADKNQSAKGVADLSASALNAKSALEAHSIAGADKQEPTENLEFNTLLASNNNLARVDAQNMGNQQKIELKAAEVSLASGPLHQEVMSAAKSGGGRILLELTPPELGTIRIDLRIDQAGRAHLIVEGASDATKSRLDQGGQNLKNEFAQMGLNLSLDLRQGNYSQQSRDQGFSNPRQSFYNSPTSVSQSSNTTLALDSIRSGDNGGNSNTVHLYA